MGVEQHGHVEQPVPLLHACCEGGDVAVQGRGHAVDLLGVTLPRVRQLLSRLKQLLRVGVRVLAAGEGGVGNRWVIFYLSRRNIYSLEQAKISICQDKFNKPTVATFSKC